MYKEKHETKNHNMSPYRLRGIIQVSRRRVSPTRLQKLVMWLPVLVFRVDCQNISSQSVTWSRDQKAEPLLEKSAKSVVAGCDGNHTFRLQYYITISIFKIMSITITDDCQNRYF